jgi:hypothetical protein
MGNNADWLPRKREEKLAMARNWSDVLALKGAAWGVPTADVTALNLLSADATATLAAIESPESTAIDIASCKMAFDALDAKMRYIKKRNFTKPPLTAADFISLGLKVPDTTPSPGSTVTDTVDMTITNDPVADSHRQIIRYKRLGAANKSKAPWHMAVLQIYIQAAGDPDPAIDDDALWSKDIVNLSSPYIHQHHSADAGKTCWYRAHWEAENSDKGQWSMARAMIP